MAFADRLDGVFSTQAQRHAAQDGLTLGVLLVLVWAYPDVAKWLFASVGLSAAGKRPRAVLLRRADEFINQESIADAPAYFLVPFLAVVIGGGGGLVALDVATVPF